MIICGVLHEVMVDGCDMDESMSHLILGYKKRPDLFYQIIPHGHGRASIDCMPLYGFIPKKGDLLNGLRYMMRENPVFSNPKILEHGGGAFTLSPMKKFMADNIMLVGDAAHQGGTFWFYGILNAIDGGVFAGEAAVEACEEGDFSYNLLSRYEKKWHRVHGERLFLDSYIHRIAPLLNADQINTMFHILKENNDLLVDEILEKMVKSPKITSNILNELKKRGLDINDMLSVVSLLKKYYRVFWDTMVG
ncbi:MAG: Digeranylgeranylglycerophospholipid reductase [Candidatus Methanolliviera sp. GoM_oil]|nr:MAG: Digeranylgeranylglycerophospholipid reductase [Candidatus Methanolliviera sp. GoM_oil]